MGWVGGWFQFMCVLVCGGSTPTYTHTHTHTRTHTHCNIPVGEQLEEVCVS
jgi:hypothetical protein